MKGGSLVLVALLLLLAALLRLLLESLSEVFTL